MICLTLNMLKKLNDFYGGDYTTDEHLKGWLYGIYENIIVVLTIQEIIIHTQGYTYHYLYF